MGELYTLFTIRASSVYQLAVLGLKRAITCLTPLTMLPSYHT